ncbi:hypothetical protein GCM10020220_008150 [Nonomuraea rubra]|uniref:hypothetical protein n=1 Tax=Nonomuraea rubra TaxID=46180 RepID=UPI0031EF4E6F
MGGRAASPHSQRAQRLGQQIRRVGGGRVGAAEAQVQLPGRVTGPYGVGAVHGQRRLADARRADDHGDRRGPVRLPFPGREGVRQGGDRGGPSGEVRYVGRKLVRPRHPHTCTRIHARLGFRPRACARARACACDRA